MGGQGGQSLPLGLRRGAVPERWGCGQFLKQFIIGVAEALWQQ